MKVQVWLPFTFCIPYTVEVDDPSDIEAVKRAMREKDASDWDYEPDLYEALGSDFYIYIDKITSNHIEPAEE